MKTIEMIGGVVGFISANMAFQMVAPAIFEAPTYDSINWYRTFTAGLFGALGVVLGMYAARILSKRQ